VADEPSFRPTSLPTSRPTRRCRDPLTPDDTAAVVAMLAGDDAAALTGQTLTVDGGLVLR
jgi:NAD(P)-dependent dehydrogenase (short-subunit alcohol dehydrogenase family)